MKEETKEKWRKAIHIMKKASPLLDLAIPGVGTIVSGVLGCANDENEILKAIDADPNAAVKLKEIAANMETELLRIHMINMTAQIQAVNDTMQVEAQSEKWWVSGWRPFNGFMFGTSLISIYFVLPILEITVPDVPSEVWLMWGAVLGVTAWDRGKEKRVQAGEDYKGFFNK